MIESRDISDMPSKGDTIPCFMLYFCLSYDAISLFRACHVINHVRQLESCDTIQPIKEQDFNSRVVHLVIDSNENMQLIPNTSGI